MDNKNLQQAAKVFETVKSVLDSTGWKQNANIDEENMVVRLAIVKDDLPMEIRLIVDPENLLISLYSTFPFFLSEENLTDGALALCYINDHLTDGCFDLDLETGRVCFRVTLTFRESLISQEAIKYLFDCTVYIVDEYNDKMLAISKGALSLEDFVNAEEGRYE